jgi:hypothetical protein
MNPEPDLPGPSTEESLPAPIPSQIPATTFTKVDNNLTGIGFFTASSKRSRKGTKKETVITDKGAAYRVAILPSAEYGLPVTQDQDYWLALMKLVTEHIQQVGKLTNPFTFTTSEITKILGLVVHSGRNYKAVQEWADVMTFTGVKGGAYDAAKKRWLTDRTHALDRFISIGKELPDGKIADKNYVWFSEWQLDNINSGNLIPVELTTYVQLKTNIAKNLVPQLQEWLFASQRDGRFEKQYVDVCQLLGIRVYHYLSDIERQLKPSLDELESHGYISKWAIEMMANDRGFKLVFWHGAKYHTDRTSRAGSKLRIGAPGGDGSQTGRRPRQQRLSLNQPEAPTPPAPEQPKKAAATIDETLVVELGKRGIGAGDARKLLAKLAPGQPVLDQLEYADTVIHRYRSKIQNPPGFYISRLQDNAPNPPGFETSAARKIRLDAEAALALAAAEQHMAQLMAEENEHNRKDAEIDALPEEQRQALFRQAKAQLLASNPNMADFFRTNRDAINEGFVRKRMHQIFFRAQN